MGVDDSGGQSVHFGVAGGSARREGERRKASRERRVREKHPRLGGTILALSGDPQHERTWAYGADGEERVARALSKYVGDEVVVLHDRRIRGSRANIDHIAVAPSGVWVIDTKRYKGKVAVVKPLFGEAKLTIAGRNRSGLVTGLRKQVGLVEAAIDPLLAIAPATYIAALSGQTVSRDRKASCPFHRDRTPSLHAYATPKQGWFCFGCRRGGTIYDLAAELWQLDTRGEDFIELRSRLRDRFIA